jgi:hypothetical protein
MSRPFWVACGIWPFVAVVAAPGVARSSAEVKVDRDFLAGLVEKLPPCPFEKAGRYRGRVDSFRLVAIDPAARQLLVACRVEGEFNERAVVAGLARPGPRARQSPATSPEARWRKFRFDVRMAIGIEPAPDGTPRFRFEVDEVKRRELDGLAGTLAKVMGRHFDQLVTAFADSKAALLNDRLNAEVLRRVGLFREYGVFCGIDYTATQVVLRFDVTRLRPEGVACYVFPTPRPGAIPLYRWAHRTRGDHFYAASPAEPDRRAYRSEGVACYVLPAPQPGAVPLYRWVGRRERFYATTPNGAWSRRAGFLLEGVACYVFPHPEPGTVPLYRFLDPRRGLHFYTTHPHAEFAK